MWRRGMHEVQRSIGRSQCQPYVRRCAKRSVTSIARNDPDDIAAVEPRFDPADVMLGNFVKRSRGDVGFHLRERSKQGSIVHEITIMPPAVAHFARRMRHLHSTERTG